MNNSRSFTPIRLVFLALLAAGMSLATGAAAQQPLAGTYTNIDPPGVTNAAAWGINNDGVIAGRYKTPADGFFHAFLRDENGSYSAIDPPGAIAAEAKGVSDSGNVLGYFCDTAPCGPVSTYQGFLLREGLFSSFGSPDHINTWAMRMNGRGQIVGCVHDANTTDSMHGFVVDRDGTFTDSPVPMSMHNGISPDGRTIVGLYTDTSGTHGYILSQDNFMPFDVPGSNLTQAEDLNARGEIVGLYRDTAGKFHGFLRNGVGYFSIDYPNATDTRAFAISDNGQIVGQYVAGGVTHAFLLTRHEIE
ncbi:MAG: hypothetical protein LAO07_13090 [Acidobacteriia bacterium]|nr:hypothetical protein [Terriglobia bacterium]